MPLEALQLVASVRYDAILLQLMSVVTCTLRALDASYDVALDYAWKAAILAGEATSLLLSHCNSRKPIQPCPQHLRKLIAIYPMTEY